MTVHTLIKATDAHCLSLKQMHQCVCVLLSDFAAGGIELLCRLARGEMAPRLSLVSPKVFFSVLSPMEFWFLAAVASGLLSWGHFISSDIVNLIEQKLFELN